ncbi:winged helix-turn-helix domain-containing protein [Streptomyces vinaceus]|uniref:helix-turn-helix domain-containing protein n=1 Tax=Streptomyces vinaceus TaxID=1960 RepID=UPI00382264B9
MGSIADRFSVHDLGLIGSALKVLRDIKGVSGIDPLSEPEIGHSPTCARFEWSWAASRTASLCLPVDSAPEAGSKRRGSKRPVSRVRKVDGGSGVVRAAGPLARVQTLSRRRLRVSLSVTTVWRLLKRHGWSWQAPARRALKRDEHAVEPWQKGVWPRAKASRRPSGPGSSSRTKAAEPNGPIM